MQRSLFVLGKKLGCQHRRAILPMFCFFGASLVPPNDRIHHVFIQDNDPSHVAAANIQT